MKSAGGNGGRSIHSRHRGCSGSRPGVSNESQGVKAPFQIYLQVPTWKVRCDRRTSDTCKVFSRQAPRSLFLFSHSWHGLEKKAGQRCCPKTWEPFKAATQKSWSNPSIFTIGRQRRGVRVLRAQRLRSDRPVAAIGADVSGSGVAAPCPPRRTDTSHLDVRMGPFLRSGSSETSRPRRP